MIFLKKKNKKLTKLAAVQMGGRANFGGFWHF